MTQEIKAQDKVTVTSQGERTKDVPVFVPAVDIFESEEAMTLVADLPGVEKSGLTIDLKDNTLTVRGEITPTEYGDSKTIYREYEEGDYYRQFTVSELIDQAKISAVLKDGVLTLYMPKVGPVQPRKVEVRAE
jgi:HSP20 family protein